MLLCLFAGLALLAIVNVDRENRTMNGVLIAMGSVVGMALLVNCKTWWQVMDSVLNSQRKRLHSAANRMHKLKSEGFMKVKHRSKGTHQNRRPAKPLKTGLILSGNVGA